FVEFDWIESHAHTAKIMKSSTNSGYVREDIKGTRISDDFDIFQTEVMSTPYNATEKHISDAKKTMRTDILNLITMLQNLLDCSISFATKINMYNMQSISE
ncbi:17615_t:CDS:1, partial [Acaulospora morrowiae]